MEKKSVLVYPDFCRYTFKEMRCVRKKKYIYINIIKNPHKTDDKKRNHSHAYHMSTDKILNLTSSSTNKKK